MSAIRFEINGEYVHPDDAVWYETAPCGCVCGVTTAIRNGVVLADPETAWKAFEPDRYARRQDIADGMQLVLGLREDITRRVTTSCPHDPLWGIERTPVPDGHVWAVERWDGRVKHLVATPLGGLEVRAFCRRVGSRYWTDEATEVRGKAECSPCRSAARLAASGERAT